MTERPAASGEDDLVFLMRVHAAVAADERAPSTRLNILALGMIPADV
jgi:hypothetical protein